jgi:hypothetical protein
MPVADQDLARAHARENIVQSSTGDVSA